MTQIADRLWIKICGIRDVETAGRVAELGADAIGINFYDRSPRRVSDLATAAAIVRVLPSTTEAVGVFVNHTADVIRDVCNATGIQAVQLHGDEPDGLMSELSEFRVIRALRTAGPFADEANLHLNRYVALGTAPHAWLLDARVSGAYGGTGHTLDWTQFSPDRRSDWPPLILAGGLTPENVAAAIAIVRPFGVDVASGVESSPGVKDLTLVEKFLNSAGERQA